MQRKLQVSEEEMSAIKERKKKETNTKIFKRLLAIEIRGSGGKCKDIASLLGVCIDTIADWTNLFLQGGIDALCHLDYEGRRPSKLEPYTEEMKKKVQKDSISTLLQLQSWLQKEYGVFVEQSWLSRFCKKNSICLTKKHD